MTIGLAAFDEPIWARVEIALAEQALSSARLLAGEMPPEIEEVFAAAGAPLFPTGVGDLTWRAPAPTGEVPCKHLAATFYLLAEAFDDDPFLILHWRGRDREALLARLRELRVRRGGRRTPTERATPTAGATLALAGLPEPAPEHGPLLVLGAPLPPRPAVLARRTDLLLRQLPPPDAALGGQALVERLRSAYQRFAAGD